MDDLTELQREFAHLARLVAADKHDDARLFVARLVRKYRESLPAFSSALNNQLSTSQSRSNHVLRKGRIAQDELPPLPVDNESRLSLLRSYHDDVGLPIPLLAPNVERDLRGLLAERQRFEELRKHGLRPTRSAFFVGNPGVGKTLAARWLASELRLPLFSLDLASVMSSLLGRSGNNVRAALDFARQTKCVLLLDEIDSIAKRRSDDSDVGELKRLVTVIMQEVDEWPDSGLLLAATNHSELIDPALWRRFDLVVEFGLPTESEAQAAIERFLGPDIPAFRNFIPALAVVLHGNSHSGLEREANRMRRGLALGRGSAIEICTQTLRENLVNKPRSDRIQIATKLANFTPMSQHQISELTGVSRDTIRKRRAGEGGERAETKGGRK